MPTLPQTGAPHKLAEVDWAAALEADMLVVVRQAIERIVDAELTAGGDSARPRCRIAACRGRSRTTRRWRASGNGRQQVAP